MRNVLQAALTGSLLILLHVPLPGNGATVVAGPPAGALALDQEQPGITEGHVVDSAGSCWQEFRPSLGTIAQIDLAIQRMGAPGDLTVTLKDESGATLSQSTVPQSTIESSGWVEIPLLPVVVWPGSTYYIHLSASSHLTRADRYLWYGESDSGYERGVSSLESERQGFDFGFRTWAVGGEPDLLVAEIWEEEGTIWCELMNKGEAVAHGGHYASLMVNGEEAATTLIRQDLEPGQGIDVSFGDYSHVCMPPHEVVTVQADSLDHIAESDEKNNRLRRTFECDASPLSFVEGPEVTDITDHGAVVSWSTNGSADSRVCFGTTPERCVDEVEEAHLVRHHEITLKGLSASTPYHYIVHSEDAAGNTVASKSRYFRTGAPLAAGLPEITTVEFDRVEGSLQLYKLTAHVSDPDLVHKVEFFLGDELVGTDYGTVGAEEGEYCAWMGPSLHGLTREELLEPQNVRAVALDNLGRSVELTMPEVELQPEAPNGTLEIVSPPPEFTFHCESTEVPAGMSLDIVLYAAEYEYECLLADSLGAPALVLQGAEEQEIDSEADLPQRYPVPELMPVFEPPTCRDVARAVQEVEVFIDLDRDGTAELVDTWTPPEPTRTSYTYGWDLGGLEPGRYYVVVRARLSDDTLMHETRHVEVATEGVSLEREVVPYGNFYQVSLTVVNQGSQTIDFDTIEDNLTSFQAIERETDAYKVYTEYCVETQQCAVKVDFRSEDSGWRMPLAPGQSLTASYLAVPIRQVAYVDGFRIGADDVVVTYDGQELCAEASFSRPVNPHVPPFELSQALNGADYLIVTNPGRLFIDAGPGNIARAHVNTLLSAMADLARWKNGTLGYFTVPSDMDVAFDPGSHDEVRAKIHSWGSHMHGSDRTPGGYLSDGYLLIVGETEIVPSGTKEMNGRKYLSGEPKPTIHCTDMYYASTAGSSFNPQLKVGRIVGNDAVRLTSPLETSIAVESGVEGHSFDRSQALLLSGWPSGRSGGSDHINFLAQCTAVQGILEGMGTDSYILDSTLHESEVSVMDEFTASAPGSSIIHLAGHGNTECCDEICAWDLTDPGNLFTPANPFVCAISCHTAQYEAGVSLAEAFLQSGAGAYLGTADVSYCCSGTRIAKTFYERWTHGKSLGTVLRELKRSMGDYNWRHPSWGYEEDIWTSQYQLYGDPKYGRGEYSQVAGEPKQESVGSTGPQSTVDVHVPTYTVTTEVEGDYVDIPGGFATLIPGRPIVPVYDVYLDYPAGQRVQDVRLADRSEAVVTYGLDIPEFERAVIGSDDSPTSQAGDPLDWWPQVEYDWGVEENQDGSSTLAIRLYPFAYNQETTEARFYQDYSLDIDITTSTVEILSLATDRHAYAEGDPVAIEVWLRNAGEAGAEDLYIEAILLDESSGEMVDSLPLEYVGGLSGLGSVKLAWDSGGTPAGRYGMAIDVREANGNVLDRSIVDLQIGIRAGEISSFEVSPVEFEAGDEITIAMVFKNTGTVTLDGTAVVSVPDATGEVVEEFTHAVTSLAPGATVTLSDTWDTSGAIEGTHHVVGRVRYHSTATSPAVVTVTSLAQGSWPDEHKYPWLSSGRLRDNAVWAGSALVAVLLLGAVFIKARKAHSM